MIQRKISISEVIKATVENPEYLQVNIKPPKKDESTECKCSNCKGPHHLQNH